MNIKKYTFLLLALLFITQSCEKFLEEELISDVAAGNHYSTSEGLDDAVDATYAWLKGFYGPERGFTMTTFGTDIFTNGADGSHKRVNLYDGSFNASHSYVNECWRDWYRGINQANGVINRAPDVEMDEALKTLRIAEVRWLRAFYYFDLVRTYGDVHLTLEETVGVETEANKTAAAEVYSQAIIPDLEFAIANLPNVAEEYGRATKAAAEMLLGKVLLRRSYTSYAGADDASRAETLFGNVINNYGFELLPDYGDLWDINNQENSEIIWNLTISKAAVDDGTDDEGHRGHLYFLMEYDVRRGMSRDIANGRPWKRFRPTPFFLGLIDRTIDTRYDKGFKHVFYANKEVSDERGNLAVGDTALYIPGPGKDIEWPQARKDAAPYVVYTADEDYSERVFPSMNKWIDDTRPDRQKTQGQRDVVLMRLADAYLLRAEAKLKQSNPGGAADDINVVRARAAVPGQEAAMQITGADVTLDFLLDERAREMYGEHARWWDLTRTGKLVERVKLHNIQAAGNIQEYHNVRPIGQNQIDRTVGGYQQNPGYPQ
ncbi:RagB/SusD family nutrient uptake outer membrane protein [Aurantibacter crassamenti]|uniref:RagB/SusD family nutrient uptake outer membrane protein n=1 Tax=Aurantibacter crassamenti TaxID=1837375 RepID=UPI00193983B1|nr:RagB/SusD family nutrient uptake outer membrane protein [Aurantibacter crassamenti]MBM1106506.1 RagB/SusD family nutrient uptake outer membrane protein [Aurantibacter crassamenti]